MFVVTVSYRGEPKYTHQPAPNPQGNLGFRKIEPIATSLKTTAITQQLVNANPNIQEIGSLTGKTVYKLFNSRIILNPSNNTLSDDCCIRTMGKVVRATARFLVGSAVGFACGFIGFFVNTAKFVMKTLQTIGLLCACFFSDKCEAKASQAWKEAKIAFCGAITDLLRASFLGTIIFAFACAFCPDDYTDDSASGPEGTSGIKAFRATGDIKVTGLLLSCVAIIIALICTQGTLCFCVGGGADDEDEDKKRNVSV